MALKFIFPIVFLLGAAVISYVSFTLLRLPDDIISIIVGDPVKYVGAVLEYEPYVDWKEGGEAIIKENARIIAEYATEASNKGADIFVAPEYCLNGLDLNFLKPEDMFSLMQFVPDPELRIVPCTSPLEPPNVVGVQDLSCSALENSMYTVVDVGEASPCSPDVRNPFNNALDTSRDCPDSGYIYYNTQVVFDRDGAVIARYRKINLFLEPQYSPGLDPDENAMFTTDFGVTFSLQICFDISFFHPGINNINKYGIQDIIMSTSWVDILPFYIAPAVQNSWSQGLGVNLLVAGFHNPERAKLGSGIYRGASDLKFNYTADPDSGARLLVSEVDTVASLDGHFRTNRNQGVVAIPKTLQQKEPSSSMGRKHTIYHDNLSNYSSVLLFHGDETSDDIKHVEACHDDGFCCSLSYQPIGKLNYSLVAYSGNIVKGLGPFQIYAQICSVLWCKTDDKTTCTHIEDGLPESDAFGTFRLHAAFNTTYVYPSVFDRNLNLAQNSAFNVTVEQDKYTLSTDSPTRDLLVAGLFGRWFEKDGEALH